MSTRTDAITEHRSVNYRDIEATAKLLADSVPAGVALREYWSSVDPESSGPEPKLWRPAQHFSAENADYLGPGGLLVAFGPKVLRISASARWSGFLTIKPLRDVHLVAFRSIAKCVQGTRLLLLPDGSDVGYHAVSEGLSLAECEAHLREEFGPPQPSVEAIPAGAFEAHIPGSHRVWFDEKL